VAKLPAETARLGAVSEAPGAPPAIHGTCIAITAGGVLLRGPSGAGKSDLALRLIFAPPTGSPPWWLVADDRVILQATPRGVEASCPLAVAGLIEARGVGIVSVPHQPRCLLRLVVDLVDLRDVPRSPDLEEPEQRIAVLGGLTLPRLALHAFEPSAPLKVHLALLGTAATA
jgi:HPr kinase/phosphorylase